MGIKLRKTCIFSAFLAVILLFTACEDLFNLIDGDKTVQPVSVTGVSMKASISLVLGEMETLTATITPSSAADKNITWESNNAAVATVSDGLVTAVAAGTATITVTTVDGGKTANCTVTVNAGRRPDSVRKVFFSGPTETVTLDGLSNNAIYLVKVNTSNNTVSAANTGGSSGSSVSVVSGNVLPTPDDAPKIRMGHPAADKFHANPPPFERKSLQRSETSLASSVVYSVGAVKQFWVEKNLDKNDWVQKSATLVKQGTCGNIWVMNDLTTFTFAQAQAMADKFDEIYPIETSLLGYEYGGGPGGNGGKDSDTRIQILVYDIGYNPAGTTLGYFWGKDYYDQDTLDYNKLNIKTNLAEIFYLNGNAEAYTKFGADQLYSTLVHEFQHMINFNVKYVKNGKNSDNWYNEMLSMLAEDVISPLIGIDSLNEGHPIKARIPTFLAHYHLSGITEWGPTGNQLDSYATAYTFGAYLLRNYGGASLLQAMLANNLTNIESVTAALKTVVGSGLSFEEAVRRYGEALVFSGTLPADVHSFDKTVTKTIGAYPYTAAKFNIWSDFGSNKLKIFGANEKVTMRQYSLTVHQASGWTNQSGTKTITLQRPNDPNVEFYLMVK
jgi:hypothetical protein